MPDDDVPSALLRQSVEDLRKAVEKLSGTVSDYNVLQHRVTVLENDNKEMKARKVNDRRLIIAAFLGPFALWLAQLFYASQGSV